MATDRDRLWAAGMPEAYERYLVPLQFRPFALDLAARVAEHQPRRVLELAAGTGALTAALVKALPDAEIVATDLNPPMVEQGKTIAPTARWQVADALDLPFDDAGFDIVACQFGVMFFPDRTAGFAQALRVLRPGGTFMFSAWDAIDKHDFAAALVAGLERVLGEAPPFLSAVPHGYHDEAVIRADLAAAGATDVVIEHVTIEGTAASAEEMVLGYCMGTPTGAAIRERGSGRFEETVDELVRDVQAVLGTGEVVGSMTALVVQATPA